MKQVNIVFICRHKNVEWATEKSYARGGLINTAV